MLTDAELLDIFDDDDAVGTAPSKKAAPKRPPRRRPPRAAARSPIIFDRLDDGLDPVAVDDSPDLSPAAFSDSDPVVSRFCNRVLGYFDRAARYLLIELRSSLEGMLDPSETESKQIETTFAALDKAIRREFTRYTPTTFSESITSDFFNPYQLPFQRAFKDAATFTRSSTASYSYMRHCTDAAALSDRLRHELLPFRDLLDTEIVALSTYRIAIQSGDAGQSAEYAVLKGQKWDLEARAASQQIMANSCQKRLAVLNTPIAAAEAEIGGEAISGLIGEIRKICESQARGFAAKCRVKSDALRQNRAALVRLREDFVKAMAIGPLRRAGDPTEVQRSAVPGRTDLSGIGTRGSEDTRMSALQSALTSMHAEQQHELDNATTFLETLQTNERAQRKRLTRQGNASPAKRASRTLYHY
jgi:hypothetical protein